MNTLYLVCAVFGGTILVIQTLMLLIGLGGHDVDVDGGGDLSHAGHAVDAADSTTFFKVLSLKAVVAFLTFFGLVGLLGIETRMGGTATALAAIAAGTAAVFVVGYLMAGLARLQSSGNVDLSRAVGSIGQVYVRIPGEHGGSGVVIVEHGGRRFECHARTVGPELPAGAEVKVVQVSGPNTVEVAAAE